MDMAGPIPLVPPLASVRHGGEEARRWRRSIARLSSARIGERTFTLKFPIELPEGAVLDFPVAKRLYDAIEGTGSGSLLAYVCGLHLAGFRVFTNVADAQAHRRATAFQPERFKAAAEKHLGIIATGFNPQTIVGVLNTKKRKGLDSYDAAQVAARFYIQFTGDRLDEKADAALRAICEQWADLLVARFPSWNALYADPAAALQVVDDALQAVSADFPSLRTGAQAPLEGMADAPIAHRDAPGDLDPAGMPVWLHRVVAKYLPEVSRSPKGKRNASELQNLVLSFSDNALSWLFNKGLAYFRKRSAKDIAQDFGIASSALPALERLHELANAVPAPCFLDKSSYSDFRKTFAGKIRSWMANYLNRLEELDALFERPVASGNHDAVLQARHAGLFDGLEDVLDAWTNAEAQIPSLVEDARHALARLTGRDGMPAMEDVERIDRLSQALRYHAGFERMLIARVEQRDETVRAAAYGTSLVKWCQDRQDRFDRIPMLPRISGALPDVDEEARHRSRMLNGLIHLQETVATRLETHRRTVQGAAGLPELLHAAVDRERRGIQKHPRAGEWLVPERLQELAARRFLSQVASLHRRLSPTARTELLLMVKRWNVLPDRKAANRWLVNRKGQIYRSPWSTARHEALAIRPHCWEGASWLQDLIAFAQDRHPRTGVLDAVRLRDWLQIAQFLLRTQAESLTDTLPRALLEGLDLEFIGMAPQLRLVLERERVDANDFRRFVGLLQGELARVVQDCLRSDVMLRAKFQPIGNTELVYVPKARPWTIPDRYLASDSPLGATLARLELSGAIDPVQAGKRIAHGLTDASTLAGAGALLRQLPHDWFMPDAFAASAWKSAPDAAEGGPPHGIRVGKGVSSARSTAKRWPAIPVLGRLVGVSSFKSVLDRVLLGNDTKFGDLMLILDQHYRQTVTAGAAGLEVRFEPFRQKLEVAVPITTTDPEVSTTERDTFFDRFIAIDLGERRIGHAAFDLAAYIADGKLEPVVGKDGRPLTGSVPVPSVRRLIQAVQVHRGKDQPGQKIGDRYSKRLEHRRENVVADVCRAIDALCHLHGGFPVLESSVRNLEAGARQLDLVYRSVLNRYTFSTVDAHRTVRRQYWFGGEQWKHPSAQVREWDERSGSYGKGSKPLTLFPGATISPAGTSQTCCRCDRNPVQALRSLGGGIHVTEGGRVRTDAGTLRLLSGRDYDEAQWKRARREKRNLPMNRPLQPGRYAAADAERYLKMSLRQPAESQRARDTSQSRYCCVFIDCHSVHHADEGAAVNIGRKFLREKIVRPSKK